MTCMYFKTRIHVHDVIEPVGREHLPGEATISFSIGQAYGGHDSIIMYAKCVSVGFPLSLVWSGYMSKVLGFLFRQTYILSKQQVSRQMAELDFKILK